MPTFGLVSRAGVITNSYTFDHCGPLARTVEDCALVLEALAGYDPKDAGSLRRPIPPYREALGQDLRGLRIGVLRHHWEEDIPASEDVRRAMDAALDVLRRLGAELEECRVRPLGELLRRQDHHRRERDLQRAPEESDLPAQGLRRRLSLARAAVRALHRPRLRAGHARASADEGGDGAAATQKFDAFVTAGMGEAPRLADYRSVSFWQKPSLLTAWNVTGQPVLMLPNGFGRNGLPLGMQMLGRPFGETTILRIGHAYERATEWHTRRPQLVPGAAAPDVVPPPVLSVHRRSGRRRDARSLRAGRPAGGPPLDDLMLAQLLEGAPYALDMVRRLRRDHDIHHSLRLGDEPVKIRPNRVKQQLAAGQGRHDRGRHE